MPFRLAALALAFLALTTPAAAAPEVLRGPAPEWTDPQPIPDPSPERSDQIRGGVQYLLREEQVRWRPGTESRYLRLAYRVADRSGLESAARINPGFDPINQTLTFNHLRIHRDGTAQDRLAGTRIETFRREQRLEDGRLDGRHTANLILRDVRVGDIVDYAFTIDTRLAFDGGHFADHFDRAWSEPLGLSYVRMDLPAGLELAVSPREPGTAPQRTQEAERQILEWRLRDPQPVSPPPDLPGWVVPWQRVHVASAPNWAAIADIHRVNFDLSLPLSERFARAVDRIAREAPTDEARIAMALRLVQDRIRYVHLGRGSAGYLPRSPAETEESGYGDCKDKSLLLAVVLRRLGIEAHPALTSLERGPALAQQPPSPWAFDHAVVRARANGKEFWLDPTGSHQGGEGSTLAPLPYGYALPLVRDATLQAIARPLPPGFTTDVSERYDFAPADDPGAALALTVTTVYRGEEADRRRAQIARRARSDLAESHHAYYARLLPGIERAGAITVEDDLAANRITLVSRYRLPGSALAGAALARLRVRAFAIEEELGSPPSVGRTLPFDAGPPRRVRHRVLLRNLPQPLEPVPPQEVSADGLAFSLAGTAGAPRALDLEWRLRADGLARPADEAADYARAIGRIADATEWSYSIAPPAASVQPAPRFGLSPRTLAAACIAFGVMIAAGASAHLSRAAASRSPADPRLPLRF